MKKLNILSAGLFTLIAFSSPSAQAEWKSESIQNVQVHYYLPKNANFMNFGTKKALMINLHGCSQKAEDLKKDGNWENAADEFNMIVALPKVPNGGVYSGCWDYYGADHTTMNRHNVHVLNVVKGMLSKVELNIDPTQVYVSGLSSGGGLSMVLGCLAPDVFAGIGLNAGPSTGTAATEISRPQTTFEKMMSTCRDLGKGKQEFFKTQLTSIIYGNNDFIVSTTFNTHNAEIMRTLYGAENKLTFDTKKLEGSQTDGTGAMWADAQGPRVSLIMNTGLGHNWPAGQGGNSGSFINKKSINYPHYLAEFFATNNRRSANIKLPALAIDPVIAKESRFHVSGAVRVPFTNVRALNVIVKDLKKNSIVDRFKATVSRDQRFLGFSKVLPDGEYDFSFELNAGPGMNRFFKRHSWLGEVQGTNAPQLVNTHYQSVRGCLKLKGQAVSSDGEPLKSVSIVVDENVNFSADIGEDTLWSFKTCDLTAGDHTANVFTETQIGQRSNAQQISFKTEKNLAVSTLQDHMEAKRLKWADYGGYYLKYGNSHFALYLGEDGIWRD